MMKPGLGKGLGQLMKGDRVAAPAPSNAEIGRGLNTLIGTNESPKDPDGQKVLLPTWFFFAADVLLLTFAAAICFEGPKPLDFGTVVFATVAVGLGAILGIAGVLRGA